MKIWRKEKSLVYALHPDKIPASSARFTYTFGLGGLTLLATLVTVVTGFALAFYYVPTPDGAHPSIVLIDGVATFGAAIRALHYWGAQMMVVAATLHLARIVFTGGYRPPRELNWLIGLGLLVLTLLWDFSGYVLRWDDGGYWALLVGTNLIREIPLAGASLYRLLVGDTGIGAAALLRFYAWHIFGLSLVVGLGIVYHLWRLRKDGGISRPVLAPGQARELITRDELFAREFVVAGLALALLVLISVFFPIPVGTAPDLNAGPAQVRAPWIFLWVQNLLRVAPPLWAGILLPMLALAALALIPFIDRRGGAGRAVWFARERWKPQLLLLGILIVVVALSLREAWP